MRAESEWRVTGLFRYSGAPTRTSITWSHQEQEVWRYVTARRVCVSRHILNRADYLG